MNGPDDKSGQESPTQSRPYLSVLFACCSVYQRIYRNAEGTAYSGRCPRCGKPVKFDVGPGGTDARQFVVY
ncbi:MAG: hypothetical protein ABSH08_17980 [Tepidisphaeraceae bacterium]